MQSKPLRMTHAVQNLSLVIAIAYDIYLILVKRDVCADLYSLEINVPNRFSGTVGFPPPMEGLYIRKKIARKLYRQITRVPPKK